MGADLTVRQKILVAASALGEEADTFSVEDLIVRSWQFYPEAFSLRGYHGKYPDSNRVLAKLSGVDGLCGLGWLEHTDQRMYRLTRKGRLLAKQLQGIATAPPASNTEGDDSTESTSTTSSPNVAARREEAPPPKSQRPRKTEPKRGDPPAPVVQLTPQEIHAVGLIAKSDALRKFLRGSPLTFADACVFWGISASRPAAVQERLDATEELLKRVVDSLGAEGATDSRLPSLSTCYGLLNLHRLMLGRFARELDAIRTQRAAG
jgi:hypothetical protein